MGGEEGRKIDKINFQVFYRPLVRYKKYKKYKKYRLGCFCTVGGLQQDDCGNVCG